MAKWNYLTYHRICHDSIPFHHAKSEVLADLEEAIRVKHESNVVGAAEVVGSVVLVIMAPLRQGLHRNYMMIKSKLFLVKYYLVGI